MMVVAMITLSGTTCVATSATIPTPSVRLKIMPPNTDPIPTALPRTAAYPCIANDGKPLAIPKKVIPTRSYHHMITIEKLAQNWLG